MTQGEQLLELADDSWNERRGEYHGLGYSFTVTKAMQQDAKENGKQGRKRKVRRQEAARTVNALFDRARKENADRLTIISGQANGADASRVELESFAADVSDDLVQSDQAFGTNVMEAIDISMIISLITAIVTAIKNCKNLQPAV